MSELDSLRRRIAELESTERDLRLTDATLRATIDSPQDIIVLSIDCGYRYLHFNDVHRRTMKAVYGVDVSIGMNLLDCMTGEADRALAQLNYDRALAGESHSTVEEYGDIERAYYESFYAPIKDAEGKIMGATAYARNVTERIRSQELLDVRLRLREAPSDISVDDFMQMAIDEAERITRSVIGFFHFVDEDQTNLHLQVWSTRTAAEYCQAEGKGLHYPIADAGVWVDAIKERRPVIHNDYATLAHRKGMPEGHAELVRELVVPVIRDGRLVAVMGVGNKPVEYAEADVAVVEGIADLAWDMVQRRMTELALRQTIDSLTASQKVAHLGDWRLDVATRLVTGSDELHRLFGLERGHLTLQDFAAVVDPQMREWVLGVIAESMRTGGHYDIEHWLILPDGTRRFVRAIGDPVLDEMGEAVALTGIVQDITDIREAEAALAQSEAKYRSLVETAQELVWMADAEGRFTYLNPAWERTHGYKVEEMLGRNFGEFQRPEVFEHDMVEFARHMAGGSVIGYETTHIAKDGRVLNLIFNAFPLIDAEGAVIGTQGTAVDITERKRAEEALATRERDLQDSQDLAHVGSWRLEVAAARITWSEEMKRIYGRDPAEFEGDPRRILDKCVHPDDLPLALELLSAVGTENLPKHFTYRIVRPDGSVRHLAAMPGKMEVDEEGRPVVICGTVQDVTEQWEARRALDESEARLRLLADNSKDLIYRVEFRPEQRFSYVSPSATAMTGYSPEEHYADPDLGFKLVHPDDVHTLHQAMDGARDATKPIELRWVKKNGDIVWTEQNNTLTYDDEGQLLTIDGIARDITERKAREEDLRLASDRLQNVIDGTHAGTWEWNVQTGEVDFNETWAQIVGYSLEELEPVSIQTWRDLTHPDDLARSDELLQAHFRGDSDQYVFESRMKHKDGHWVWVLDRGRVVGWGADGTPLMMYGTHMDITERKAEEEARRRLDEEIARTHQLESLGQLAGGIAHDFNNLLGGIFGFIDLAHDSAQDPQVRSYLSRSLSTIERARALTRQLLTFASGGAPVKGVGPLFPFLQEAAEFTLSGSNVAGRFCVPEALWWCDFDRNQIGQVIDNLVKNAQQAMPAGGTIDISAEDVTVAEGEHAALAAGPYVRVVVRDNGPGIPDEVLPKIFDPFFTTKAEGHGLGLSTCHSILSRHGGTIVVHSKPGQGSSFDIYLPALPDADPAIAAKAQVAAASGSGAVLVMDDEEIMRESMKMSLSQMGFTVTTCRHGQEAIELFTKETEAGRRFSAIFLDLTIPGGLGGVATAAELRKIDSEVPIFVASGYAEDPVMAEPHLYGFSDSIEKPFTKAELRRFISANLGDG